MYIILLFINFLSVAFASLPDSTCDSKVFLQLLNDARTKNNLKPVCYNLKLEGAALWHTIDMKRYSYFNHTEKDGMGSADRLKLFGFAGDSTENIAWNKGGIDAKKAFDLWSANAELMKRMLGSYNLIGLYCSNEYATLDLASSTDEKCMDDNYLPAVDSSASKASSGASDSTGNAGTGTSDSKPCDTTTDTTQQTASDTQKTTQQETPSQPSTNQQTTQQTGSQSYQDTPGNTCDMEQFKKLINDLRAQHSLGALEYDDTLNKAAMGHSQDMANRNYFEHDTPEGTSPFDRMHAAGFPQNTAAAENIAMASNGIDSASTYDMWFHSPGHLENMLGQYNVMGLACYKGYSTLDLGAKGNY